MPDRRWEGVKLPKETLRKLWPGPGEKRGGGRKPKYEWEPVRRMVMQKLREDGAPKKGDGGQAKLEKFVAEQFLPDACPSEAQIRDKVAKWIADYWQEIG